MSVSASYMTIAVSRASQCTQPTMASSFRLEAVEVVCDSSKFRLTFKTSQSISDVLSDSLCQEIMLKVADFEDVDGMLTIPDYYFACEGFSLRRLSVFGSERRNGRTLVTLRWSRVTGSIHSALKVCPEHLLPPKSDNARLGFQVLDCVLQPIFNLTETNLVPAGGQKQSDEINALINDFVAKRDELEKYAQMLKIYLEHEVLAASSDNQNETGLVALAANPQRYIC